MDIRIQFEIVERGAKPLSQYSPEAGPVAQWELCVTSDIRGRLESERRMMWFPCENISEEMNRQQELDITDTRSVSSWCYHNILPSFLHQWKKAWHFSLFYSVKWLNLDNRTICYTKCSILPSLSGLDTCLHNPKYSIQSPAYSDECV